MTPVLEVRHVTVGYGGARGQRALADVEFSLQRGEQTALIGRSGAGKSTLARCVAGWLSPDAGGVTASGPVRLLPQDSPRYLNPRWMVERIMKEPLAVRGQAVPEERLRELLARTGLPASCLRMRPWQLSSGQRQRVAIVRLFLGPPFSLLVLDEPFAGQDPATREQLWSLIDETRKAQDFAILHAGHDLPWLRRVCSRVLVLESGRLVEDRAGPEPFERLRHPAALDLLRAASSLEESR